MRMRSYFVLMVLLCPLPTSAQEQLQSPAYLQCAKLAGEDPQKALLKAEDWLRIDDSVSAHHCRAMALYGLQRFADAADALELVRDKLPPRDIASQTYVTHQAAKAWLNAGRTDAALFTLSRQIDAMGRNKTDNATAARLSSELLVDRATIRKNYGQLSQAVKDLDQAISLTPLNVQVLLLRATIFQELGDFPLSLEDTRAVLKLDPKNTAAKELLKKLGEKR